MRPAPSAPATTPRGITARLLDGVDHYEELVQKVIAGAKVSLWIATANVKELRVEAPIGTRARAAGRFVSILETFAALKARGVELRFLHGGVPSGPFQRELAKQATLRKGGLPMRQCPRVHLKLIAVDGRLAYVGSANFTGAGLGAKGEGRRNFEAGVLTDDDVWLDALQDRFDRIWSGRECKGCKLRRVCPRPLDTLGAVPKGAAEPPSRGRPVRKAPARLAKT